MSLMISSITLVACVLFPTVAASPATIDDIDTTQPFADVLNQAKQDRASWCAAFEDAELLHGDGCEVVQAAPLHMLQKKHVFGISETGRVNTVLLKMSARAALSQHGIMQDTVDANALPPELEILVADPPEAPPENPFDRSRRRKISKGWKGRLRGKARLRVTDSTMPTYFVPFDLEHVPAPKGEHPITISKIWFGVKFPDGTVKWPDRMFMVISWLHPSVELPNEAVAYLNRAVESRIQVWLGYRPRRFKFVVDLEEEAGRCAEVRMGGSTEALPMEDGEYRGKAARVGMVDVDENAIELFLDCVLDQPSHEVVPVRIDFRR